MKKCRYGANACCGYVGNSGCCNLPEDEGCINQITNEVKRDDIKIVKTEKDCTFIVGNYVAPDPPLMGVASTKDLKPKVLMGRHNKAHTVAAGVGVKVGPNDKNKIKICCDEITLTKDSIGIKVDMSIRDFDKFETIEINGRVFKRVREE